MILIALLAACAAPPPAPTVTPTSAPLPTPIATALPAPATAALPGLGVSRAQLQTTIEGLQFVFDPPETAQRTAFVLGNISLTDGSVSFILLTGPPEDLYEVAITFLEPVELLESEEQAARERAKIIFILQETLNSVMPAWGDSPAWLDDGMRSFSGLAEPSAAVETEEGGNEVILALEAITTEEGRSFLSFKLTIRALPD
jgi:hypothetical protein